MLFMISAMRTHINDEFKKNKEINDDQKVEELVSIAKEVEHTFRTRIVQAELNPETGNYRMNITDDTVLLDNKPFDPDAELPKRRKRTKCDEIKT
ncbi:DNA replication licensing factor [Mactra antiquata]